MGRIPARTTVIHEICDFMMIVSQHRAVGVDGPDSGMSSHINMWCDRGHRPLLRHRNGSRSCLRQPAGTDDGDDWGGRCHGRYRSVLISAATRAPAAL